MTATFPTLEVPCVLYALPREAKPFLKRCWRTFPVEGAPCAAWLGDPFTAPVLVLATGIGPAAARAALGWLVARPVVLSHRLVPKLVVSAGFVGALQPELAIGDVIWATEIMAEDGASWRTTWPIGAPTLPGGRLLSVPRLIGQPAEKERLGQQFAALAVDMESAELARQCNLHDLAFGAVRAVSDAVNEELDSRLAAAIVDGRVKPLRLTAALIRRPALAGQLVRLARASRRAAAALAPILAALLELRQPWCGPVAGPALAQQLSMSISDRQVVPIWQKNPTDRFDSRVA